MSVPKHGALEKSDNAVSIVIHQQDFYWQIVLRQRGQLMRCVLKSTITGDAYHAAGFPLPKISASGANGSRQAISQGSRSGGIQECARRQNRKESRCPVVENGLVVRDYVIAIQRLAQQHEGGKSGCMKRFQPCPF